MSVFAHAELAAVDAILREAGRAEVMPRFGRLPPEAVRAKSGPTDLVTDADEAAERQIAAALRARFPGCLVIGEEAASNDATLLPRLAEAPLAFVVDPIDGTNNYAAGLPLFGMMAAAICARVVVGACIHDPVMDDSFLALAGGGAWAEAARLGRRRLRVSPPAPVAEMSGTLSWRFLPERMRLRAMRGSMQVRAALDFRCAAHQYRLLADGQCHFSVYHRLLPWDHAPGWLLHREAGGHAARFDGSPYDPANSGGGLICAADAQGWRALHRLLIGDVSTPEPDS